MSQNRLCGFKFSIFIALLSMVYFNPKVQLKKYLKISILFTFRPVFLSFLLRELIFICLITGDLFIEKFLS